MTPAAALKEDHFVAVMIDRAIGRASISHFRNNRAEDQIRSGTASPIVSLGEQTCSRQTRGNAVYTSTMKSSPLSARPS